MLYLTNIVLQSALTVAHADAAISLPIRWSSQLPPISDSPRVVTRNDCLVLSSDGLRGFRTTRALLNDGPTVINFWPYEEQPIGLSLMKRREKLLLLAGEQALAAQAMGLVRGEDTINTLAQTVRADTYASVTFHVVERSSRQSYEITTNVQDLPIPGRQTIRALPSKTISRVLPDRAGKQLCFQRDGVWYVGQIKPVRVSAPAGFEAWCFDSKRGQLVGMVGNEIAFLPVRGGGVDPWARLQPPAQTRAFKPTLVALAFSKSGRLLASYHLEKAPGKLTAATYDVDSRKPRYIGPMRLLGASADGAALLLGYPYANITRRVIVLK